MNLKWPNGDARPGTGTVCERVIARNTSSYTHKMDKGQMCNRTANMSTVALEYSSQYFPDKRLSNGVVVRDLNRGWRKDFCSGWGVDILRVYCPLG